MLMNDCIKKLLGLKDVELTNIEEVGNKLEIHIKHPVKLTNCPHCNQLTNKIHDYRTQRIKDSSAFGKPVVLVVRKRRYRCPDCGKCFYEKLPYIARYQRMTHRFRFWVLEQLREVCSFSSVARQSGLAVSSVIRIFDIVHFPKPKLPSVLGIDEFKGNTGRDKYQVILTDLTTNTVLDILPCRHAYKLVEYFKSCQREGTTDVVSDMSGPFTQVYRDMFPHAKHAVDKYHVVRQVIWAFESVRREEQKKFNHNYRKYFKQSKSLLLKQFDFLSDERKQQVNVMLYASADLSSAHFMKEKFQKLIRIKNFPEFQEAFKRWILDVQTSHIPKFKDCANTFYRWYKEILHAYRTGYTNGFTEGCNNKIKVIKRNAYGYRNFERFRKRILFVFSDKQSRC